MKPTEYNTYDIEDDHGPAIRPLVLLQELENRGFHLIQPKEGMFFINGEWREMQEVVMHLPTCDKPIKGLYGADTRCARPLDHLPTEHKETDGIHRKSDWPALYRLIPQEEQR